MDWRIAGAGLLAVAGLLAAFSLAGVAMGFTAGTIHVSVPEAQLRGVTMYGGKSAPVVTQEIEELSCPRGQVLTTTMDLGGGLKVTARIGMDAAELHKALLRARGLANSGGALGAVVMTVEDVPALQQTVENGTMYGLEADIYFISMGSLRYENTEISFD